MVFETYLLLLEEEHGMPLNSLTKNYLLFGLLGTEGHKQFSGNPAIKSINMATYAEFSKAVVEHFQRPVNTACAIWDLQHQKQGATETAAEFLAALRDLIPNCGYSTIEAKKELALSLLLRCHSETAQLQMLKLEPDLNMYYHILGLDEWSTADVHIFQNSVTSPSYLPLAATYRRSDMCTNLQSRGGKG